MHIPPWYQFRLASAGHFRPVPLRALHEKCFYSDFSCKFGFYSFSRSRLRTVVLYNRTLSPWQATVTRVEYGGRRPHWTYYDNEYWKHSGTKYYRWDGSRWRVEGSVSAGSWRSTGSAGNLDIRNLHDDVVLNGGARVDDFINYRADHIIFDSLDQNRSGLTHQHFLE